MGRHSKPNKEPESTISISVKFKENHVFNKPRNWTWGEYVVRKFDEMSEIKDDLDFYKNRCNELSRGNETYVEFIKRISLIDNEELQSLLKMIISSNGNVAIAQYKYQNASQKLIYNTVDTDHLKSIAILNL